MWDAATGKRIGQVEGHELSVQCLAFSPDGRYLWSIGYEGKVLEHSTSDWSIVRQENMDVLKPYSLAVSPRGGLRRRRGALQYRALRADRYRRKRDEDDARCGVLGGQRDAGGDGRRRGCPRVGHYRVAGMWS